LVLDGGEVIGLHMDVEFLSDGQILAVVVERGDDLQHLFIGKVEFGPFSKHDDRQQEGR